MLATILPAGAQARKGLYINEVMVTNTDNFVDDFGNHGAWIELFNSKFAPMDIASVYITTDPAQPRMYPVPLGDVNTKISKRQHVVFWADGRPERGTFHTNFTLNDSLPNWIGIYEADGITLIDSVTVPPIAANSTWARVDDGKLPWELREGSTESIVTPSTNNRIKSENPKIRNFAEQDKNGFGMTITAMAIVFLALLLLSCCFYVISKIGAKRAKEKKMIAQGLNPKEVHADLHPDDDSGEAIAAIAMALYEHLNAHDSESTVLTINKVRRAYSPWSSHIYGLRRMPERR